MKIEFFEMIDSELDQFDEDSKRERNLKTIVDFNSSSYDYENKDFEVKKPKLKKKEKSSIYIKKSKGNRSLF